MDNFKFWRKFSLQFLSDETISASKYYHVLFHYIYLSRVSHREDSFPTCVPHEIADYSGHYVHPAYGMMSIREQDGMLHWSGCGLFATMAHRHYETFELPEVPDRHVPDRLPITFLTDREGNIVSLSAPLEPAVKDIVFARLAAERVDGTADASRVPLLCRFAECAGRPARSRGCKSLTVKE